MAQDKPLVVPLLSVSASPSYRLAGARLVLNIQYLCLSRPRRAGIAVVHVCFLSLYTALVIYAPRRPFIVCGTVDNLSDTALRLRRNRTTEGRELSLTARLTNLYLYFFTTFFGPLAIGSTLALVIAGRLPRHLTAYYAVLVTLSDYVGAYNRHISCASGTRTQWH